MQEKAARLYEHLTGGIFFDRERVFTKGCLERIVTDVLFSEAISKGWGRDQVVNDARYTMLRWGFTVPEREAA